MTRSVRTVASRSFPHVSLVALTLAALAAAGACTSETPGASGDDGPTGTFEPTPSPSPGPTEDAGAREDTRRPPATTQDSGPADTGPGPSGTPESEPNNGTSDTDLDVFTPPGRMTGTIAPADDTDVFGLDLVAGDFWTLTADVQGSALAPHLGVIQKADRVPRLVAVGGAGASTTQDVFVLASDRYYVSLRDARNVPAATSQHVGGPTFGYGLVATKKTPTATTLPLPGTVQGTLASRSSAAFFSLKLTTTTGFDLDVRAKRKLPATDLDTRVSLFDVARKTWIFTNDDISAAQTDSRFGSDALPPGDYLVIVDNVASAAAQLGFELVTTLR